MTETLLDQVQRHRKHIKHDVLTYAVSEIVNMRTADPPEIEIQPDWQRLFRWSREQQSSFIESLILEIPVPPLFFFERAEDGRWELLDGLQRVSTILKFMGTDSDVPAEHQGEERNNDEWHYTGQNDLEQPLQLVGTEYLSALEGLSFARLPTSLKLNLKRSRLQIYVLKRETDRMYKYEVFKRLNSGGSDLEDQELRNCAVRVLDDRFPEFVRQLGQRQKFRDALGLTPEELGRAYADELALRFLTMKNHSQNFKHDVAPLLTQYMEQVAKGQINFDYDKESALFDRVWMLVQPVADGGDLFRSRRQDGRLSGRFSPTLFELVSIAVAANPDAAARLSEDELKKSLGALVTESREFLGSGTNSKKKTIGRIKKAKEWFGGR